MPGPLVPFASNPLMMNAGTQLGPYRVESLIGAGGMGEVYLGVDTRLDRQVAIKILSGTLASDASLRERFEREARTISSLSHSNICTLFDLGRHQDSDYLVMEYLQGETLADRIARGALPAREVIRIGLGIASALEAAHRQGIVHRDLKPGNVMLTKGGVKLLDFGLAKLTAAASTSGAATMGLGATEQKPLTEQGTILGTFQYMAPEQLEGQQADARTDIFALGAILYEMATGRRAFQGTTKASLIAAIIDRDPPPMTESQPLTPPALERIVRACLAKDPDERLQTAHDVALQLRWIAESSTAIEAVTVRRRAKLTPWIAAAVLGLATIVTSAMLWREKTKPPQPYSLTILAPRGYDLAGGALSPDGKSMAIVATQRQTGERSLWLRRLDDGSERQLAKTAQNLFWSPDGQWIGYYNNNRLMRVRVEGGQPETICRTSLQGQPTWGEDGTILFSRGFGHGLWRVPATGGDPVVVTKLDSARSESVHTTPRFLPGDRRFLYLSHTTAEKRNEIWAGSMDGEKATRVVVADALAGYSEPYLVFVRDGAAYAQRFDAGKLRVEGEAQRIADDVAFYETEAAAAVSLSPAGAFAYARFPSARTRLNVHERNGALASVLWEDLDIGSPSLSRDETTLIVSRFDKAKGANDVYAVDLQRKVATRITTGLAAYNSPLLSPDGQTVAFHSDRGGMFDIYAQALDGSTQPAVVWKDEKDKFMLGWHPDGRHLIVGRYTTETRADLWVVPLQPGQKPWPYLVTESVEGQASFSPDGKWVAYIVSSGADDDVYVRPFPKGRAIRVSTDGGGYPSWRADGLELAWASKGRIMSVAVDLSARPPRIGQPQELFRLPRIWSAPRFTKDGRIAVLAPAPDEDLTVPFEFTTAWRMKMDQARK
jgi:serine/threonine protein kinase/Tol biopolymer transport system component